MKLGLSINKPKSCIQRNYKINVVELFIEVLMPSDAIIFTVREFAFIQLQMEVP
jgi:hypothetical protein